MSDPVPQWLWLKLKGYLAAGMSGQVQFKVEAGRITHYQFIESGAVAELSADAAEDVLPPTRRR